MVDPFPFQGHFDMSHNQQLGKSLAISSYVGRVMLGSKAAHQRAIRSGRFRSGNGKNKRREGESRSSFVRHFSIWFKRPPWMILALLALCTALGIVLIAALLPKPYDSSFSRPPHIAISSHPISDSDRANPQPASAARTSPAHVSEIKELHNKAKTALDAGQFEEAASQYRIILENDPADEDSHFGLGVALARQGRNDEAVREYEEALRLMPNYAEVHNNLGNLLAKQGKLAEAIEHFQAALKTAPDYASALNNMGTVLARQGKHAEAREAFENAVKAAPDYAAAHFNLGTSLMRDHKPQAAAHEFEETLKLQPEFRQAAEALALAQKQSNALPIRDNGSLGSTPP
jgi:Tfp pilus assembly protein PilF